MLSNFLLFLFGWLLVQEGQSQTEETPPNDDDEETERWEHMYEEY